MGFAENSQTCNLGARNQAFLGLSSVLDLFRDALISLSLMNLRCLETVTVELGCLPPEFQAPCHAML